MEEIEVKRIVDVATLRAVETLQQTVWGMPPQGVVPHHQLVAATAAGGAVFGAFTGDGQLVGFTYGFIGLREGRVLFYSHMAGVQREYRGANVGFRLKCAQRQFALDYGIDRMVWTFDPLVAMNAHFNLHKLGAVASRYYVNYYGEMTDELNEGMESDRVEVDWWLRTPRVDAAVRSEPLSHRWDHAAPVLLATPQASALVPGDPVFALEASALRLEIPLAFPQLKAKTLGLAQAWRFATRQTFRHYFDRGYSAVDFVAEPLTTSARGAYILVRSPQVADK